jgi:hypothetical protein
MTKDIIKPIMRRSNLNQFLLAVILVALAVFGATQAVNYYRNMFNGPFEMSQRDLLRLDSLEGLDNYYVTLEGDEAFDTGYQMVTKWNGLVETGHTNYGALLVNDQFLLYSTNAELGESPSPVLTGALTNIDSDARQVLEGVYSDVPDLRGEFLPFMLDTHTDFRMMGFIGLGAITVLLLVAVFLLYRLLRRIQDPTQHPVMAGFKRYGQNRERAMEHFQREMDSEHLTVGKLHLTKNWLAQVGSSSLQTMLLKDIVWMYRKTTQHRTNGIPTGKTHSAIFHDRYGTTVEVKAKEKVVNEMLTEAAARSPHAFMGFDKQLEKAWKSQRETMVQAVEMRRAQG